MSYPHIGQRLFNTPLLLRPEKCELAVAALLDHFGIKRLNTLSGEGLSAAELSQLTISAKEGDRPARRQLEVVDGVAIIPVMGSLVQRVAGLDPWSGMCGYNQIETRLEMAMSDPSVRAILVDVDSGGGEVSGCFDLARKIARYSKRHGGKPIVGAANEMACSAAYALISGCDEIYMPETAIVGSIGVWVMLVDLTKALDKNGVEVTMIRAGDRKARGGPYEKADKETFAKLSAWVEETRERFCNLVAQHRRMNVADIKSQEADWFHGDEAGKRGLVDGFGPFQDIFQRAHSLAHA